MTIIETPAFQADPRQAFTHVFVVGVGAYRHLRGGAGELAETDLGLRQLTSPPISARAFATWVFEHQAGLPTPLGTVDVLISEAAPAPFPVPNGADTIIEPATTTTIVQAWQAWFDRCNADAGNVAIFYFCGHGVQVQGKRLLLAQDFGANNLAPFGNTINFDDTLAGMAHCQAGVQCYFVDACRQVPFEGLQQQRSGGQVPVEPRLSGFHPRDALVLNASAADDSAYALANDVSRFTKALLLGLDGLGGRRRQGKWEVNTIGLGEAVVRLVDWLNRAEGGTPQRSTNSGESTGSRPIYVRAEPPIVPVAVRFQPDDADPMAHVRLESRNHESWRHRRAPGEAVWVPDGIKADIYSMHAEFGAGGFREVTDHELWVVPPVVDEPVPVEAIA